SRRPPTGRNSESFYEMNRRASNRLTAGGLLVGRQRRRAGRGSAAAGANVLRTALLVFLRRDLFKLHAGAVARMPDDLLQKRHPPAAAGAGAAALRKLAHHPRLAAAREVLELAPRDVKAEADLGVGIHHATPTALSRGPESDRGFEWRTS